jgi:hypothetical protein
MHSLDTQPLSNGYLDLRSTNLNGPLFEKYVKEHDNQMNLVEILDLSYNNFDCIPLEPLSYCTPQLEELILYNNPIIVSNLLNEIRELAKIHAAHRFTLKLQSISQEDFEILTNEFPNLSIQTQTNYPIFTFNQDSTFSPVTTYPFLSGDILQVVGEPFDPVHLIILTSTGVYSMGANQHFQVHNLCNNTHVM